MLSLLYRHSHYKRACNSPILPVSCKCLMGRSTESCSTLVVITCGLALAEIGDEMLCLQKFSKYCSIPKITMLLACKVNNNTCNTNIYLQGLYYNMVILALNVNNIICKYSKTSLISKPHW